MRHSGCSFLLIVIAFSACPAIGADTDGASATPIPAVAPFKVPASSDPVVQGKSVDHDQAMAIARMYFLTHVGCGGLSGLRDLGDSWKVEGSFGYAGTPIEGFLINKATGALTLPPFWVQ